MDGNMSKHSIKTPQSEMISDISYHDEYEELTVHIRPSSPMNPRRSEVRLVYSNVPKKVFLDFKKAESKGGFFNREVKNVFPFLGQIED